MSNLAKEFAAKKHQGQLRDDGKTPSTAHHNQVAEIVKIVAPTDHNLIAAAYLHDVIEDTETTYKELVKVFNQDVADLVMEVTDEGKKDSYGKYFPRLKTQRGIMLKFADRLSNLADMDVWHEPRRLHYLKRSKFWKDGSDLTEVKDR